MAGNIIVFTFILISVGLALAKIPDYIQVCKRNDPEVSRCIMQSIEHLRPLLKTGLPEINVPAVEPLHIREINVNRGMGRARFDITLKNVTAEGASDFKIKKLKLDIPNHTYKIDLSIPNLYITGNYDVDAQILALPLKGEGPFECTAVQCDATGILKGEIQEVDGVKYMHFVSLDINLDIKDYDLKLGNLFSTDDTLNEAAKEIIKANKVEILRMATPYITDKASEILLDVANNIGMNFAYDEVFPEN